MGNITCIERHINPNLACYRDSDLRICVSLRQYAFKIGVSQQHSRLPLALVEYDFSNAGLPYRECLRQIVEQEALLDPDFNYGQQTFTVPDAKSTLIPACFYEAQHAKDYISAIYPLYPELHTDRFQPHPSGCSQASLPAKEEAWIPQHLRLPHPRTFPVGAELQTVSRHCHAAYPGEEFQPMCQERRWVAVHQHFPFPRRKRIAVLHIICPQQAETGPGIHRSVPLRFRCRYRSPADS